MQVIGIIAEYNPFHLGHLYHLQEAKKKIENNGVVAIMSGSFLQRGEPALVDKWVRTEMALKAGVNIVLELPTAFAVRSAHWFAQGGVKSLAATGIVTHLAFGAETENLSHLKDLAQKINNEDPDLSQRIEEYLKLGYSYPKSRSLALGNHDIYKPNDVLAVAYLRVLDQLESTMEPILIKRIGNYHAQKPEKGIASATAIRKLILNNDPSWVRYLPHWSSQLLLSAFKSGRGPVTLKSLEQAIMAVIRRMSPQEIKGIIEVSEGLENRLLEIAQQTGDIEILLNKLKTKRYTYTRIQRLLIHLFLNFTEELSIDSPQYLRVLGFNKRGRELLKIMKKRSTLPIITKFSRGYQEVNNTGKRILDLEILATDLYHLGFPKTQERKGHQDFYRSPMIISD